MKTANKKWKHAVQVGGRLTSLYQTWKNLKSRCTNPNNPDFAEWGGRGITLCDRWRYDFDAFCDDLGPKPGPEYTLERKHNDQGYNPDNCFWATREQQAANRRPARRTVCHPGNKCILTLNGQSKHLSAWAAELGISPVTLSARIRRHGWSIERALTTPARKWQLITAEPTVSAQAKEEQYVGVSKTKSGQYAARVSLGNGRNKFLGVFATAGAAAVQHDLWSVKISGASAKVNFPELVGPFLPLVASDAEVLNAAA
jgi:hypothetical protein